MSNGTVSNRPISRAHASSAAAENTARAEASERSPTSEPAGLPTLRGDAPTGVHGDRFRRRFGQGPNATGNTRGLAQPGSGVGARAQAVTHAPRALAASPAPAPSRVSPVPPGYTVPQGLRPSEPVSTGERVLAGFGIAALAPIYLLFALIALIPSLIGGAIEAPKEDQSDGSGTFGAGFANVFRKMMGWLNGPLNGLIQTAGSTARQFFVDTTTDPNNTILTVRVHLTGDPADVAAVRAVEEQVEAHMAIPGYMVNVEFVDQPTEGSVTIAIDPNVWSNSNAWNPYDDDPAGQRDVDANDVHMIAHELFHTPLGLPDEYNYQSHFTNPNMGFWQKVGVFFSRLVQPDLPSDADQGIMGASWRKPLPRHYEAVVNSVA